jgi:hypothetical protein
MFTSAIQSVNSSASVNAKATAVNSINKRPAKCDTDPTIQGFAVCRR